jgi:hypothetical protein
MQSVLLQNGRLTFMKGLAAPLSERSSELHYYATEALITPLISWLNCWFLPSCKVVIS